jgi:hypothetical protein
LCECDLPPDYGTLSVETEFWLQQNMHEAGSRLPDLPKLGSSQILGYTWLATLAKP